MTLVITLDEYWRIVHVRFLMNLQTANKWRWGQTCMNVLREENPRLAASLPDRVDVFNCDVNTKTYDRFVEFLDQNWALYV